jgi:hypothetical protein
MEAVEELLRDIAEHLAIATADAVTVRVPLTTGNRSFRLRPTPRSL